MYQNCGFMMPPFMSSNSMPNFQSNAPFKRTDHMLGKKAMHYNLADQRTERECEEGQKLEFEAHSCEVTMHGWDEDWRGLQKLCMKDKALVIPVRAGQDFELSMDRARHIAQRLDFGDLSDDQFNYLVRGIDHINEQIGLRPLCVEDIIDKARADKTRKTRVRLQSKLNKLSPEDDHKPVEQRQQQGGQGGRHKRHDREDNFEAISGMKVQRVDGQNQVVGTIIGGRKDETGKPFFEVVWDIHDNPRTEHNLNEVEALLTPVNAPNIVRQKIDIFEKMTQHAVTPQPKRRARTDGISSGMEDD